jgi:Fe-only nitrogenase accessory protein AnfO
MEEVIDIDNKVAVFLNDKGETTSVNEDGIIKVYSKESGIWEVYEEKIFGFDKSNGMKSVRESLFKIIEFLKDCKVFVASEIMGVTYNILDSNGFNLWEIEGMPKEFLDYVLEETQKEEAENEIQIKSVEVSEEEVMDQPIETEKVGYFYLNLKKLQETKSSISSKQALLPFIRNNTFKELELLCTHVPPWIENFVKEFSFRLDIFKIKSNEYKVIIYPLKETK